MRDPLGKGHITQRFHDNHKGIDFGWIPYRTDPRLVVHGLGEVVESRFDVLGGNVVAIKHELRNTDHFLLTRYVHLKSRAVIKGDLILPGAFIGIGGNTGNSTGPHLHYETWICPKTFNYVQVTNTARNLFAINPALIISMPKIDTRGREVVFVSSLSPTNLPIAKPLLSVRLRAMPGLKGVQLNSPMHILPSEGLPYLGKMSGKIDGFEWGALLYDNQIIYCALASSDGKTPFVKIENDVKEVIVEKIVEVEKPISSTLTDGKGLTVRVEKVVAK